MTNSVINRILKVSNLLSWINLIFWGFIVAMGLLYALALASPLYILAIFLLSSICLHSYAALQLHKSIRNPAIPLKSQTSAGIRFVGFFALFFAIIFLSSGISILANTTEFVKTVNQSTHDLAKAMQVPNADVKEMTAAGVRGWAIIFLLSGLSIGGNIILNLRLLRWYILSQQQKRRDEGPF
jgi:hypothetical protein